MFSLAQLSHDVRNQPGNRPRSRQRHPLEAIAARTSTATPKYLLIVRPFRRMTRVRQTTCEIVRLPRVAELYSLIDVVQMQRDVFVSPHEIDPFTGSSWIAWYVVDTTRQVFRFRDTRLDQSSSENTVFSRGARHPTLRRHASVLRGNDGA